MLVPSININVISCNRVSAVYIFPFFFFLFFPPIQSLFRSNPNISFRIVSIINKCIKGRSNSIFNNYLKFSRPCSIYIYTFNLLKKLKTLATIIRSHGDAWKSTFSDLGGKKKLESNIKRDYFSLLQGGRLLFGVENSINLFIQYAENQRSIQSVRVFRFSPELKNLSANPPLTTMRRVW